MWETIKITATITATIFITIAALTLVFHLILQWLEDNT